MKEFAYLPVFGLIFASILPSTLSAQTVQNFETPGNLARPHDLKCMPVRNLQNVFTPADMAQAISACGQKKRFGEMAELFMIYSAYGRFDQLRVSDKSAHQAITVMNLIIGQELKEAAIASFQKAVGELKEPSSERFGQVCAILNELGPPNYHPNYMIQHGMGAFRKSENDGLVSGFSVRSSWNDVVFSYIKCLTSHL